MGVDLDPPTSQFWNDEGFRMIGDYMGNLFPMIDPMRFMGICGWPRF